MASSSEDDYESSDSEIEEVQTRPTGRVEPLPIWHYRRFHCGYPDCVFSCTNHRRFADHIEELHECAFCGRYFADVSTHICPLDGIRHQQFGAGNIDTSFFKLASSVHSGLVQTYEHEVKEVYTSISDMFVEFDGNIRKLLREALDAHKNIKVQFKILVDLINLKTNQVKPDVWISTGYLPIRHLSFISNYINYEVAYLNNTLEIYNQNESGYSLKSVNLFQIVIMRYQPLAGSGFIPLPKTLKGKRGLLNIHATRHFCFHYAIVAAFYETDAIKLYINKKRAKNLETKDYNKISVAEKNLISKSPETYLPFLSKFNFEGLRIPTPLEDFDLFENSNNISINCYTLKDQVIVNIRATTVEKERHVDLLWYQDGGDSHYVLIKNLSAFLGRQHGHSHVFCKYCLRRFRQPHALKNHMVVCLAKNKRPMLFPKDDFYQFKNMHETLRYPYVFYFDLESYNQRVNQKAGPGTINTGILIPAQYSLILVGPDGLECAKIYDDENVISDLLETAERMADKIRNYLRETNNRIPLTNEQEEQFRKTTACELCLSPFTKKNGIVRHHNHFSGQHEYFCCSNCNKRARINHIIPVISHGGTNFDHHLVIKGLKKHAVKSLKIIPQSTQNFMAFILNNKLKLLDSAKFMPFKLSKLAKALLEDGEQGFQILFQYFKRIKPGQDFYRSNPYTDDEIRLLLGKQSFPYDIMTDRSCFDLTELPPIEKFRNNLKLKDLKPKAYAHALLVWKTFNIKTFKEYSRLYCMVDTLILASVMEAQRQAAYDEYKLEMLHKYSAPGFSHSAGFFTSRAKVQYMKDEEMIRMIKSGLRGGCCFANTRLFTANSERLPNYDPAQERTHIFYADLKSLYPSQLLKSVPQNGYTWLTEEELKNIDIPNLPHDSGVGYIFECDLIYDKSLHDFTNDFPLAATKKCVTFDDISALQADMLHAQNPKRDLTSLKVERLVLTVEDKPNYVTYYKTLQFYLKMGLQIGKLRRGVKFNEAPIFKDFMGGCLAGRDKIISIVMKLVKKLGANSFYGKMIQDLAKYKDIILCKSRAHALHLIAKAEFCDFYPISEDLSIFIMNRKSGKESSLFFIGFVVLELAKLRLLEVHYQGVKKVFGGRCQIAYSDTDSAIYLVSDPANTFIADLKALSWIFDYSTFKPNHECMDIYQFCGLSAKLYSYIMGNEIEGEKKAKGVTRALIKRRLQDYVKTVQDISKFTNVQVDMNLIRSKEHQMYYQTVRKVALSSLDLKRWIMPNGIDTFALGHYRIKEMNDSSSINQFIHWFE